MPTPQPNLLIAEDADLQYAIAELMKAYVPDWGTSERNWRVEIRRARGVDDALNHETLTGYMKAGGLRVLGIAVDADNQLEARWRSVRQFCANCDAQTPVVCPAEGLVVDQLIGESGIAIRFCAWFMPDNLSEGMIENFCFGLIPEGNNNLLEHAASSVGQAKFLGAPFAPTLNGNAKARLHTWLAWQNPPGQSIGKAIASQTLQPKAPSAEHFVSWFRELYRV